jgi:site-specific recombinase XerC|tara:strand:+ start:4139 stop:4366 length:228 start_codon:yes stop_codon:yes gene_type:complete
VTHQVDNQAGDKNLKNSSVEICTYLVGTRKKETCTTHMLEGGADIRFIQQLLGHAKLETTANLHTRSHKINKKTK